MDPSTLLSLLSQSGGAAMGGMGGGQGAPASAMSALGGGSNPLILAMALRKLLGHGGQPMQQPPQTPGYQMGGTLDPGNNPGYGPE